MSDLASLFSYSSEELKDNVSQGRNEQNESDALEGRRAHVSGRSPVLSFRRGGAADASREDGGPASLDPASLDPVAHPAYQTRPQGVAHPIYQFGEEPLQMKPIERTGAPLSEKTELDIRAFVDAVAAAFPKPRDPQMARVIRARPKRAARPFLYVAGEQGRESEIQAALQSAASSDEEDRMEQSVKASRTGISRNLDVLLYDPILEEAPIDSEGKVQATGRARKAKPQDAAAAAAGGWSSGMPDRRSRKRESAPVQVHERPLIEAVIEPLDPVAKPRLLPVLDGSVTGVPARLSPFQRAQLRRPKTVRDCHGRITPVEYGSDPAKAE